MQAVTAEAMTAAVDDHAGLDARRRRARRWRPESESRSSSTAAPPELPKRGLTGLDRRATRPTARCQRQVLCSQLGSDFLLGGGVQAPNAGGAAPGCAP